MLSTKAPAMHPLGTKARVLLSSVFGPFAQDDEFGSRKINPMELYHNQVTRVQGPFSLRIFHPSFGLMMLQANMDAPCTLLDFPRFDDFVNEIKKNPYDIVGIGGIVPNVLKVKKMCEVVGQYQPEAKIVVGGHVANIPHLKKIIDADFIVRGDGVTWFRQFLGQDLDAPLRHPVVNVRYGSRVLGMQLPDNEEGETVAAVIPSVGCPMGCNFCSTSAMFGGKGKFINFYDSGDELYDILAGIEAKMGANAFFVFDENFLLHKKRALRLLELLKKHNKSWSFYVFSSARVLKSYTMEQLIELGISWVWMGLEGKKSQYIKIGEVDTRKLVKELQSHGIGVLGSTIIGLEEHTPDNIDEAIEWAVSHGTDFHQFMLYTPLPGTPLYTEHQQDGSLLPEEEFPLADVHGQFKFNFRHPHITKGLENEFLLRAFQEDFRVNGPSIARTIQTRMKGYLRYKNDPDPRIRVRFENMKPSFSGSYAWSIWAMCKWYKKDPAMRQKLDELLHEMYAHFGWKPRILSPIFGRIIHFSMKREEKRLNNGWTYEPAMRYLKNTTATLLQEMQNARLSSIKATVLEWVDAAGNQEEKKVTQAPIA